MATRKVVGKAKKTARRVRTKTRKRSTRPQDAKIRKWISEYSALLVESFIGNKPKLSKRYLDRLDFSPASLRALDGLIKSIWHGERPSDKYYDDMVLAYGAYVAEVIQRNNQGVWVNSDYTGYKFECTRDGHSTGVGFNPWGWTYKRFDEGDLLAAKYNMITGIAAHLSKNKTAAR